MDEKLQRDGAISRAAGMSFLDNPFMRSDAMPSATGETIEAWRDKLDAWHFGWTVEDAIRSDPVVSMGPAKGLVDACSAELFRRRAG